MKIDMHCHVKEGSIDSRVGIEEYITILKEHGFQGMVITDHDTYNGYRYWKKNLKGKKHTDFVVLKGIEYDTRDAGHILVIMPEGVKMRLLEMRGMPLALLIDLVHRNGGVLGLEKEIAASESSDSSSSKSDESTGVFQGFKGKDLDGNDVDDSLFAKNKVTVVNFWFSGCKPCVGELSKLNELNETLKEMGGEVVGINTDTLDNNEAGIKEAKEILKAQGASYKNLTFDSNSTVGKYAGNIMAFPTTVLVDKDGNIVGEPFMGGIDDQSNYDQLMKQIQSVLDQN